MTLVPVSTRVGAAPHWPGVPVLLAALEQMEEGTDKKEEEEEEEEEEE